MSAYLRFVIAMLIFGSIGIFVQAVPLESAEIVASRTILGSVFLFGMLFLSRKKIDWIILKKNLLMLVLTGIVMGLNWLFLFAAYRYTSVSVATLVYYCAPVFVLFLSPILLKERLTWPKILGIGVALFGMVLVNGAHSGGPDPQKGFLFGLLAAIFYAGLMLLNKKISGVPPIEKTLVQLMSAAVIMTVYAGLTHEGPIVVLEGRALIALLLIGILHTGIAYLLYISSMQELPGQTVALCSYIDPASALIFSAVLLQERLTLIQLLGAVCILAGSAFGELYKKKTNKVTETAQ